MANVLADPTKWSNAAGTAVWDSVALQWVTDYTLSGGVSCNMTLTGAVSGDTIEGVVSVIAKAGSVGSSFPFGYSGGGYLNLTNPAGTAVIWSSPQITPTTPYTFSIPAPPAGANLVFSNGPTNPYGGVDYEGVLYATPPSSSTPFWENFVGTVEILS